MDTKDLSIVYCVRDTKVNDELKYSLRSLKNIPHKDVWVVGGCPCFVNEKTVNVIKLKQSKGNKWLNTSSLLEQIVDIPEITDDFIWFNDDFFVLEPIENLPYYYDRNLLSRTLDFAKISWSATQNAYCSRLKLASRALKFKKKDTLNYELHLPMIFNKEKLKEIIKEFPGVGAKRSLYGNMFVSNSVQRSDIKIYDQKTIPNGWDFVSTSDASFLAGNVGRYLKKKFRSKCEYEL